MEPILNVGTKKDGEGEGLSPLPFFIDKNVWYQIEEDLGEITDFEVLPSPETKHTPFKINYKSNGVSKTIYVSSFKTLLQSFLYCLEEFTIPAFRKYKPAS